MRRALALVTVALLLLVPGSTAEGEGDDGDPLGPVRDVLPSEDPLPGVPIPPPDLPFNDTAPEGLVLNPPVPVVGDEEGGDELTVASVREAFGLQGESIRPMCRPTGQTHDDETAAEVGAAVGQAYAELTPRSAREPCPDEPRAPPRPTLRDVPEDPIDLFAPGPPPVDPWALVGPVVEDVGAVFDLDDGAEARAANAAPSPGAIEPAKLHTAPAPKDLTLLYALLGLVVLGLLSLLLFLFARAVYKARAQHLQAMANPELR